MPDLDPFYAGFQPKAEPTPAPAAPDLAARIEAAAYAQDIESVTRASNGIEHAAGFQMREAMRALRVVVQQGQTPPRQQDPEALAATLALRNARADATLGSVRAQLEAARVALGEPEDVGHISYKDIAASMHGGGRLELIKARNAARAALAPEKIDALLERARKQAGR